MTWKTRGNKDSEVPVISCTVVSSFQEAIDSDSDSQ